MSGRLRDEFQQKHTFAPQINSNKQSVNNSYMKRNLEQFLQDQESHVRKIQEKIGA